MAGIVKNHKSFQRKMELLSMEFDKIALQKNLILSAFGEGKPMEKVWFLIIHIAATFAFLDNFVQVWFWVKVHCPYGRTVGDHVKFVCCPDYMLSFPLV